MKQTVYYDVGLIMAPWVMHFAKWIGENARHPVRVLLRDGEMVDVVAKQLIGADPVFDWAAAATQNYLTRNMLYPLRDVMNQFTPSELAALSPGTLRATANRTDETAKKILDFLELDGWNKGPFTVVDTGYLGTLSDILSKFGFKNQTLFAFSGGKYRGFYNELFNEGISNPLIASYCEHIEHTPKGIDTVGQKHIGDDLNLTLESAEPHVAARHADFMCGLRAGAGRIKDIGINNMPDAKQSHNIIFDDKKLLNTLQLSNSRHEFDEVVKLALAKKASAIYD